MARGFTLFELMFTFVIIFVVIIGLGWYVVGRAVFCGNQWFFDSAAIQAVQVDHPEYVKVVKAERNVYDLSRVLVETKDGERKTFCIDGDVFVNLDVSDPDGIDCKDL